MNIRQMGDDPPADAAFLIMSGVPVDGAFVAKLGMPPYVPKPGYAKTPCDVCDELLWLGPKQQAKRLAERERWVVLCVKCVAKLEQETEGGEG